MASGAPGGMPDSDEEDLSMDQSGDEDGEGDGGFFSGEDDLQEVEIEDGAEDDDDEDDDGEDLMSEGGSFGSMSGGSDAEDGMDEGEDLPADEQDTKKSKKKGRNADAIDESKLKKTTLGTKYASYEDFAHLLEADLDGEDDNKFKSKKPRHQKPMGNNYSAQKRRRTK